MVEEAALSAGDATGLASLSMRYAQPVRVGPAVATAEVVYNRQVEIRQLLIDWVVAHGTIDPGTFATDDWRLVSNGVAITIT